MKKQFYSLFFSNSKLALYTFVKNCPTTLPFILLMIKIIILLYGKCIILCVLSVISWGKYTPCSPVIPNQLQKQKPKRSPTRSSRFFNCIFSKDGILLLKKPNFSIQKIEPGKNKSVFPGRQATCGRAPSGPRIFILQGPLYWGVLPRVWPSG